MSDYAITFARSAREELDSLEASLVQRIFPKIESLAKEPRPQGCIKLHGRKNLWRIRIGGYRVLYAVHDDRLVVDIIAVSHRKDIYR